MEKIKIPEGTSAEVSGFKVKISGKLGTLERDFYNRGTASIVKLEKTPEGINVVGKDETRKSKALVGTIASHLKNMVAGVNKGYKYSLKVHYVHFPMSLEQKGQEVTVKNYMGEKGNRKLRVPDGVKIQINKQDITLTGIDLEKVGQGAANFEIATRHTKNDRRRFQDGIFIVEKAAPME
ncbi:MAG: 50S ribosomal protein L6 [Candidatus Aenigmarchaeota archaeon]|nr:50S ribosomal protein L6 [Candidatus Aenigmarchaeota archaeon]